MTIKHAVAYRTGKYDAINWKGFPDEGYRFYFDDERRSHLTIRPSGTSNALRFHVQLLYLSDPVCERHRKWPWRHPDLDRSQ